MAREIRATKNGRERSFNKITWDALPEGKDGWETVSSAKAPAEIETDAKNSKETKTDKK